VLAYAAEHPDFEKGLALLMAWPALPEASQMIMDRAEQRQIAPERAEAWAAKLRRRFPAATQRLLHLGAAAARKQRALKLYERLTQEADAIAP